MVEVTKNCQDYENRFHNNHHQRSIFTVTLLSLSDFDNGYDEAYPKFGSECLDVPVEAYIHNNSTSIWHHAQDYQPDTIVMRDSKLLRREPVLEGIRKHWRVA